VTPLPRCALAAVALAVLAGCGGGAAPGAAPATTAPATTTPATTAPATSSAPTTSVDGAHNAVDVMFAQMMGPHHRQGIEIVGLAANRAASAEVRILAAAIATTQAAEADTMASWLRAWGKPATAAANEHAAHGGMPGTSQAELAALKRATGTDFDRTFLNMMIAHQDDAIQMARSEAASGVNPQATALAKRIGQSRSAQITQMLALLHGGGTGG